MKRTLLFFALTALSVQGVGAQTVLESKTADNWYVGINNGVNFRTVNASVLKNLNLSAGMRLGKNLTPVFGMAIEGDVYFNNKGSDFYPLGTFVKGLNVSLLATTNITNWFSGYLGEPRKWEIAGVYGIGWGHIFSNSSDPLPGRNALTSKMGLGVVMNFGPDKAWQLYMEPSITYALYDWDNKVQFDLNSSAIGIVTGVNYKFGNSNGTHNFALADLFDAVEYEEMNGRINSLREEVAGLTVMVDNRDAVISRLKKELQHSNNACPGADAGEKHLLPVVIFRQGKSIVDKGQLANISLVARYLQDHSDINMLITGYASIEGGKDYNMELSVKRAKAVRDVLVECYGIPSSRLVVRGYGATDQLFDERDYNRVVVFVGE